MSNLDSALARAHDAIGDLASAAAAAGSKWANPRAPGKWSPSQIVEHVARALEESAHVVAGRPSKFPTLPAFVRPAIRGLLFNRILKKAAFPRARTNQAFNPAHGPSTPAEGRARLEAALASFDMACRVQAATSARIVSTIFGAVSLEDYVRFQEIHVRHHRKQIQM